MDAFFVPLCTVERCLLCLIGYVCYVSISARPCREKLVAEREGAARAWEGTLRSEQAAAQQALQDAEARVRDVDAREEALKEEEQVLVMIGGSVLATTIPLCTVRVSARSCEAEKQAILFGLFCLVGLAERAQGSYPIALVFDLVL